MTPAMRLALISVGEAKAFAAGDILRAKGAFASDMLLILDGRVECILSDDGSVTLDMGPDTIVGEIGFLTGKAANATLRAAGDVQALSLDASSLARLRREAPEIAADVLRHLAGLMRDRTQQNDELLADAPAPADAQIDIVRCSTLDQLRTAQRLRYQIHCLERGRPSPDADEEEGLIIDEFDATGTTFIAYREARAFGTLRTNLGQDTPFGVLAGLYGIGQEGVAPEDSALISHRMIRDVPGGGDGIAALLQAAGLALRDAGARAVFLDCAPDRADFFMGLGFARSAPEFLHPDNGLSVPMRMYLE